MYKQSSLRGVASVRRPLLTAPCRSGKDEAGWSDERGGEVSGDEKVNWVVLVISSRILPSEAVLRWLAGRPEGQRACAGPPIQPRSGPGCRPECSGISFLPPPGTHPPHSHLCGKQMGKVDHDTAFMVAKAFTNKDQNRSEAECSTNLKKKKKKGTKKD